MKKEHPQWAVKHKRKGTELRYIKGKYYLYEVSSKWNKQKKRAQKITGAFLGAISEQEGLIPPRSKTHTEIPKEPPTVKEYGASSLLLKIACNIESKLQELFGENASTILSIAILRAIHQCPFKRVSHLYEHSYLSELMPGLNLSGKVISHFLREVGSQRGKIVQFMNSFVQGSKHIIFDATPIVSQSNLMVINRPGYNSQQNFDPQINLLYAFAYDCQVPVYYRIVPGHIREISAFKLSILEAGLKKAVVVADKGFGSQANIELLDEQGLQYVIPLKRNNNYFDQTPIRTGDKAKLDGHFLFQKRAIWHYSRPIESGKNIVVFIDNELKAKEEKDYLMRIENQIEGYTLENFLEKQYQFGVIVVVTNLNNNAKEVFEILKSRSQIEGVFDTLKNLLESDTSYMQNEEALEAWAFINHISIIILYKIYAVLRSHNMLTKFSVMDILEHLRSVFKLRINNHWITSEISVKTSKIISTFSDIT